MWNRLENNQLDLPSMFFMFAKILFLSPLLWEREFFPSVIRTVGHNSSAGELVYLTICRLHGPGHDGSVGE